MITRPKAPVLWTMARVVCVPAMSSPSLICAARLFDLEVFSIRALSSAQACNIVSSLHLKALQPKAGQQNSGVVKLERYVKMQDCSQRCIRLFLAQCCSLRNA
ncbi:unnamed protein product [Effrenium voratum]|nr:unnamed protein product [Effrenium voratum]